jgi:hypothetical protein
MNQGTHQHTHKHTHTHTGKDAQPQYATKFGHLLMIASLIMHRLNHAGGVRHSVKQGTCSDALKHKKPLDGTHTHTRSAERGTNTKTAPTPPRCPHSSQTHRMLQTPRLTTTYHSKLSSFALDRTPSALELPLSRHSPIPRCRFALGLTALSHAECA